MNNTLRDMTGCRHGKGYNCPTCWPAPPCGFWNDYGHPRGTYCVTRELEGRPVAMKIVAQRDYRQWSGCYSIL